MDAEWTIRILNHVGFFDTIDYHVMSACLNGRYYNRNTRVDLGEVLPNPNQPHHDPYLFPYRRKNGSNPPSLTSSSTPEFSESYHPQSNRTPISNSDQHTNPTEFIESFHQPTHPFPTPGGFSVAKACALYHMKTLTRPNITPNTKQQNLNQMPGQREDEAKSELRDFGPP